MSTPRPCKRTHSHRHLQARLALFNIQPQAPLNFRDFGWLCKNPYTLHIQLNLTITIYYNFFSLWVTSPSALLAWKPNNLMSVWPQQDQMLTDLFFFNFFSLCFSLNTPSSSSSQLSLYNSVLFSPLSPLISPLCPPFLSLYLLIHPATLFSYSPSLLI